MDKKWKAICHVHKHRHTLRGSIERPPAQWFHKLQRKKEKRQETLYKKRRKKNWQKIEDTYYKSYSTR